jgi:hypothetical protein
MSFREQQLSLPLALREQVSEGTADSIYETHS